MIYSGLVLSHIQDSGMAEKKGENKIQFDLRSTGKYPNMPDHKYYNLER